VTFLELDGRRLEHAPSWFQIPLVNGPYINQMRNSTLITVSKSSR
jgi:hypothetical protein